MQHLLMTPAALSHYHLDQPAPLEARKMLAILVESGVPKGEARRRLEASPELGHQLGAEEEHSLRKDTLESHETALRPRACVS